MQLAWATVAWVGGLLLLGCASQPAAPSSSPAVGSTASPRPAPLEAPPPVPPAVFPELETSAPKPGLYERSSWQHWIDEDGDCQDTRQEALIAESVEPVTLDDDRCRVASGHWVCPYTGREMTDPAELDVDHVVPLANAFSSGGDAWNEDRRRRFANALTPGHLHVVAAGANRSKGARGPHEWLPPREEDRCAYVDEWIRVKVTWSLRATPRELAALRRYSKTCAEGGVPVLPEPVAPSEPRSTSAPTPPDDAEVRAIIEASIAAYEGACPCPYSTMRNGRRCGDRSAWSREGARAPVCFPDDVTPEIRSNAKSWEPTSEK